MYVFPAKLTLITLMWDIMSNGVTGIECNVLESVIGLYAQQLKEPINKNQL